MSRALTVLVTRPAHQADPLAEKLQQAGLAPLVFPTLDIRPASDWAKLVPIVDALPETDLVIFVSPNAVDFGLQVIHARLGAMPRKPRIACVGAGSARALADEGLTEVISPEDTYNSETLLALPELQTTQGWQVVIFRGNGGRDTLKNTLEARGAHVHYAECYLRTRPDADTAQLAQWLQQGAPDIITLTSSDALRNLVDMTPAALRPTLFAIPLIVISPRIAAVARELGFARTEVAGNASDDAIVASAMAHGQ